MTIGGRKYTDEESFEAEELLRALQNHKKFLHTHSRAHEISDHNSSLSQNGIVTIFSLPSMYSIIRATPPSSILLNAS